MDANPKLLKRARYSCFNPKNFLLLFFFSSVLVFSSTISLARKMEDVFVGYIIYAEKKKRSNTSNGREATKIVQHR